MDKKKENTNSKLKRMRYLFFLLVLVFVSCCAYHYYQRDQEQEEHFKQLERLEEERDYPPVSPDYPRAKINPDWIGWIKIKDTNISYPVMQKKGGQRILSPQRF